MKNIDRIFDENATRYQLVKSNPGKMDYNWLFLPGGPGIDSDYLLQLINEIDVEGNYWLIDLPYNGNNVSSHIEPNEAYANWGNYLLAAVHKFKNPILVGHSFGGYFPLFFPQLEEISRGLVILNSVPSLNSDEVEKLIKIYKLPSRAAYLTAFLNNPTTNTTRDLYLAGVPYCFSENNLKMGVKLIEDLKFNVDTGYWWHTQGSKNYATIKWIPQKVPLMIVGGSHDFLTPISLFQQDSRFHRNNIEIISIPDAGHFPWMEQPVLIRDIFKSFEAKLNSE